MRCEQSLCPLFIAVALFQFFVLSFALSILLYAYNNKALDLFLYFKISKQKGRQMKGLVANQVKESIHTFHLTA